MIFSVQRFLEDHFEQRGLTDVDQYAIRVANLYDRLGVGVSNDTLTHELGRIRTAFFNRNRPLNRKHFEATLAGTLRRRFKKKRADPALADFGRALRPARLRLAKKRRSMASLLDAFKRVVEARAVDAFWLSRKKGHLRMKPEKIAQALLEVFAKRVVGFSGLVLREMASGIGFIDVAISFGAVPHLVELKILTTEMAGVNQLASYMRTEGRREGWLVLVDVRDSLAKGVIPARIETPSGLIRTVVVDVNPPAPHTL
ncbi:MAG: hypothetical protein AABO58_23955 [Acidobacteriota bacterium]